MLPGNLRATTLSWMCCLARPNVLSVISDMINAHVNDVPNFYSAMPDGKARFLSAVQYLEKHGSLPRPLVVMRLEDGLRVIDGNHRVTALCFCQATPAEILKRGGTPPLKNHQLWMGTHAAGEVPLD